MLQKFSGHFPNSNMLTFGWYKNGTSCSMGEVSLCSQTVGGNCNGASLKWLKLGEVTGYFIIQATDNFNATARNLLEKTNCLLTPFFSFKTLAQRCLHGKIFISGFIPRVMQPNWAPFNFRVGDGDQRKSFYLYQNLKQKESMVSWSPLPL